MASAPLGSAPEAASPELREVTTFGDDVPPIPMEVAKGKARNIADAARRRKKKQQSVDDDPVPHGPTGPTATPSEGPPSMATSSDDARGSVESRGGVPTPPVVEESGTNTRRKKLLVKRKSFRHRQL